MPSTFDLTGEQLRRVRLMRGLTLQQAADKVGISHSFLSQAERGKRGLSAETLVALAQVYEVALGSLVGEAAIRPDGAPGTVFTPGPVPPVAVEPGCVMQVLQQDDMQVLARFVFAPGHYGPWHAEQRVIVHPFSGHGCFEVGGEQPWPYRAGDTFTIDARRGYSVAVNADTELVALFRYDGDMPVVNPTTV